MEGQNFARENHYCLTIRKTYTTYSHQKHKYFSVNGYIAKIAKYQGGKYNLQNKKGKTGAII